MMSAEPEQSVRGCFRYVAFGLHIESEIDLPELAPFAARAPSKPDVTIRNAPVTLPPDADGAWLRVDGSDVCLSIDGVVRFRVRGGDDIAIDPVAGASPRNVRLFLLGSAMGILCHRRGLLPLHANALVVDGKAFAFAGRTGIGKSTLAAHFQSRGYEVLCDDVCVISFDGDGRPLAWPGLPRLKLWRDAAEQFGHDSSTLEPAIDGRDKYHVPMRPASLRGPYPLAGVYVLMNEDGGETPALHRLSGRAAMEAVIANTYRRGFVKPMGLVRENFLQAAAVVRHAGVYLAPRRRGFDVFAEEAARFERHIMSGIEAAATHATEGTLGA